MSEVFKRIKRGLICSVLISSSAMASSALDHTEWSGWPSVGQAQLSVFIFDVYQSRLLAPDGTYRLQQDISPHPLALSIDYQRDISQKQLIEATLEQWHEMGYEEGITMEWIRELAPIFPDIEQGQNLTYVTDGTNGKFYYQPSPSSMPELIGLVNDEVLNDAFLAIWLSPNTTYPELRSQLIGMNK